jgi:hypothetical protein
VGPNDTNRKSFYLCHSTKKFMFRVVRP